jgi:hypothetical protein
MTCAVLSSNRKLIASAAHKHTVQIRWYTITGEGKLTVTGHTYSPNPLHVRRMVSRLSPARTSI